MAKLSLSGFTDPVRRPRYLIWTGAGLLLLAAFIVVAFAATSTYWFCAEVCHKVQDDSIAAYDRSSHSKVSCMSCHEPVNADPITFTLKKAKALGELVLTISNNYELPLNPTSHLAMNREEMGSVQCTQCHSKNRVVTASEGIIIDHKVHEDKEIHCTACHNRVAHDESGDWEPSLSNPNGGPKSFKHPDFMSMTACFRCHTLTDEVPEGGIKAPGTCSACHPASFNLKPKNHAEADFFPKGHAELAAEASEEASAALAEAHSEEDGKESEEVLALSPVATVNYCATCHNTQKFCNDCHGIEMPHPVGFTENHGDAGKKTPKVCANCHAQGGSKDGTEFCNACHHKDGDPKKPWIPQHFDAVKKSGAEPCFKCHEPTYCAKCHVRSAL